MKNLSPKASRLVRDIDRRREEIVREMAELAVRRRQIIADEDDFIVRDIDPTKARIGTATYRQLLHLMAVAGGGPI